MTQFHIMWTLALMVIFIGIIAWAWSSKRKVDFTEAANLPLDLPASDLAPLDKDSDNHGSRINEDNHA